MLYNYKAFSLNTPLTKQNMLEACELEPFIMDLQANTTFYHCYYDLEKRDTFTDYQGILRPVFDTIHFDFDSDDGGGRAWEDTKSFCLRLHESGIPFHVYFSGNKGFHVAVHSQALGITEGPKDIIEGKIKNLCANLKAQYYPTLDPRIWNANRKFRAYRSQHEKSKLYKIRLTGLEIASPDTSLQHTLSLSTEEIRNMALRQQNLPYLHPEPNGECSWLMQAMNLNDGLAMGEVTPLPGDQAPREHRKSKVRELKPGTTVQDASFKFKNFTDKKCIKQMLQGSLLPQFNRHDIELALIVEMRQLGKPLSEALSIMQAWASSVYVSEPDRVKDTLRQVNDIYKKDLETDKLYQYGCYGDIKGAYCSAKCKIYSTLDRKTRPEPLDCTKAQQAENEVRRNPMLELSEGQMADRILGELGEICTSHQDFFMWEQTHWKRMDRDRLIYMLKTACIHAYGNKAKINQIESLFKHILAKIPVAPETNCFFASSKDKFNFTDGTCQVTKDDRGQARLEMKPHDRNDLLSYCAPFPLYGTDNLPRSGDFKHFIEMKQQSFGDEGIRALKELFGAALIPFEPRIFFLEGDSNSGKSTVAIILSRLLGAENVSSCDPTSDYQFEWEPSIGKIANIRRELPARKPLNDTRLKEFRDKDPIGVQRKGVKGVMASVPFIHVYCCNELPPSLEGNSGALDNRITLLKFTKDYANGFGQISNLGDWLWDRDAGGILDFAREGLQLLIENSFKYSSLNLNSLQEWQDETDPVKLFFLEVCNGERHIKVDKLPSGGVSGFEVYMNFKEWAKDRHFYGMSHTRFYKALNRCGVPGKRMTDGKILFWDALHPKPAPF